MRSGEEIQAALRSFGQRWQSYAGTERAEAQTYLNELIDCYGVERRDAGLRFEHHLPGVGYVEHEVVRPWLGGEDIADRPDQSPARWTIDFGDLTLEEASSWPEALRLVRERVRPDRQADPAQLRRWWLFWRPRPRLRRAVAPLDRYVALLGTGKRMLLTWQPGEVQCSHGVVVMAFADDYSMGVLLSRAHGAWAWARSSTLENRLRYTPSSVFATFPWPQPTTDDRRAAVADTSRRLLARRSEICEREQVGLTRLYNLVDDGAYTDLAALHREIADGVRDYEPFAHLDRPTPV